MFILRTRALVYSFTCPSPSFKNTCKESLIKRTNAYLTIKDSLQLLRQLN